LAGKSGDFELGQSPFLPGNVNPSSTLAANFQGLVEEEAFVGLIPQSGEVGRGVGSLPGNPDSCQRHRSPAPHGSKVEVLLVCEIERFLDSKPGGLLPLHKGYAAEQYQN
jgi:hypothetical protein